MSVIGQQCPGIDGEMPGRRELGYPPEEILPILIVAKYELAVQSSDHHMMECSRSV
jgi:hypothetical protein